MISFTQTRSRRIARHIRETLASALDAIYSPVISRLTTDEYFACRTRNDCLRTYLGRRTTG